MRVKLYELSTNPSFIPSDKWNAPLTENASRWYDLEMNNKFLDDNTKQSLVQEHMTGLINFKLNIVSSFNIMVAVNCRHCELQIKLNP